MKTPVLLLIFSGIIGLNKCSPEIKTANPFSFQEHLTQKEAMLNEKPETVKDTLSITDYFFQAINSYSSKTR